MTLDDFWEIIEKGSQSETPEMVLEAELKTKDATALEEFQQHFDQLFYSSGTWDLWGAAYIIGGGCSDDGFIDFRYGLISKGRTLFESATSSPDSLADIELSDIRNELFAYVAGKAYEKLTGNKLEARGTFNTEDTWGEEWDFDNKNEVSKRLPKLMKKYG